MRREIHRKCNADFPQLPGISDNWDYWTDKGIEKYKDSSKIFWNISSTKLPSLVEKNLHDAAFSEWKKLLN